MGSPANPSRAQITTLQQASELAQLGKATIRMPLPRQAVSLVTLSDEAYAH